MFLADEKHESVIDVADRKAKQRVVKTLVTGSEMMRSQEPLDEKLYSNMLEDVDRLSRFVRDRKFMQTVSQNVTYGKLASSSYEQKRRPISQNFSKIVQKKKTTSTDIVGFFP